MATFSKKLENICKKKRGIRTCCPWKSVYVFPVNSNKEFILIMNLIACEKIECLKEGRVFDERCFDISIRNAKSKYELFENYRLSENDRIYFVVSFCNDFSIWHFNFYESIYVKNKKHLSYSLYDNVGARSSDLGILLKSYFNDDSICIKE